MKNWYDNLTRKDFDVSKVSSESTGMDTYLSGDLDESTDLFGTRKASEKKEEVPSRMKVASVDQLKGFTRVANTDTLVRMSEQDLWTIKEGEDGDFVVERLFDETGNPLKV